MVTPNTHRNVTIDGNLIRYRQDVHKYIVFNDVMDRPLVGFAQTSPRRQNKAKSRALADLATNPDLAVMGLDNAFGNGQAQAEAAGFAAATFFAPEKPVKDMGQILD